MHQRRHRLAAAMIGSLICGTAVLEPAAAARVQDGGAPSSAQIVADLNALRVTNGLPPVSESSTLDADCAAHDRYMASNDELVHSEVPNKAGYSAAGAYAGDNAVLATGSSWKAGDPWANAPVHLIQMLSPNLKTVGADEYLDAHGQSWDCLTTWPGYVWQAPHTGFYSVPGPNSVDVGLQETAIEGPVVPNGWVGLPVRNLSASPQGPLGGQIGDVTGPFILLYWAGAAGAADASAHACTPTGTCYQDELPALSATSATLRAHGQLVDARLVTEQVAARAEGHAVLPYGSSMLVPTAALQPHTTYTVQATFSADPLFQPCASAGLSCVASVPSARYSFSFTTGPAALRAPLLARERPTRVVARLGQHFAWSVNGASPRVNAHWRVVRGVLPRGLSLRPHGTIVGVPRQSGAFPLLLARNSRSAKAAASQLVLRVLPVAGAVGTVSRGPS